MENNFDKLKMISNNLKHNNSPPHSAIPMLASKSSQSISSSYTNKRSLNGSVSQERLETPKKSAHAKKSPLKKTLSQELSSFISRDHSSEQNNNESPTNLNNKKPALNLTPNKDSKNANKLLFPKNESPNEKPFKRTIINKKLPTRLYTKSKHHTIDIVEPEKEDKPIQQELNQPTTKQGGIPRLIKSNSSFEKHANEQIALNKSDTSLKEYEIKSPIMTSTPNKQTSDVYNQMPNKKREIILYKDDNLGYGFIAGSEKPLVVRFVTPGI